MARHKTSRAVDKRLRRISRIDHDLRGGYLVAVSNIETYVNFAIESHFFPNFMDHDQTRLDLHWFVMEHSGLSFRTKVSILIALLKARYPDIWKAHSTDLRRLDKVAEYRNLLAHASSVLPSVNLEETDVDYVTLATFKNGVPSVRKITINEGESRLAEAQRLAGVCGDIWLTISKHNSQEIRDLYDKRTHH